MNTLLNNFAEKVNKSRLTGKTDTDILNFLAQKDASLSKNIQISRKTYGNNSNGISNDRDLVNYLAQKYGGQTPTVASVPLKEQEPQKKQQEEKKGGLLSKLTNTFADINKGAIKGLGSTLYNTGSLIDKGLSKLTGIKGINETLGVEDKKPSFLEAKNTAEKIGFGAEQIAEFLTPGGASLKVGKFVSGVKGLSKAPQVVKTGANLAGRAVSEAGIIGGQTAMQKGEIGDDAKIGAIVGGLMPVVGKTYSWVKGGLKPVGEKIQQTVIRPTIKDVKDGFKIENVSKYDVGGTLEETVTKVHTKINSLVKELQSKLKASDGQVSLNKVYKELNDEFLSQKSKNFGDSEAIKRVLSSLAQEIKEVSGKNSLVNLVEATNIKRGAGTKGSWVFGRLEADATATEKVYTKFYQKIKKAIEDVSPDDIKGINKQISELIPISNASLRRLPVEQRNNVLSLTDSIGLFASVFDPKALALIGANRLSKSGRFGQFLINLAEKTSKTEIGERIFGR